MKLLIVDDHRVVLAGLAALLRGQDWVSGVATATSIAETLEVADAEGPFDVVVLDLGLRREDGLDLIAPLRERMPALRVLVLTMSADHEDTRAAVRQGAAGYVLKDSGPDEVLSAIRVVARGGTAFSAGAAAAVILPAREGAGRRLADRDRELLGLLAKGQSTADRSLALPLTKARAQPAFRAVCGIRRLQPGRGGRCRL